MTAIQDWIRRTNGDEPPNDEERLGMIREKAENGNSFSPSDMLWVLSQMSKPVSAPVPSEVGRGTEGG
jgi:hypothetical protein